MAGSPRIIARPTTRSPAAFRRARVRQGQAFGGAEEAPSLTAAARDGDGNMRSGRKNARGSGRTKEWNAKDDAKWRDAPLTKKAPYKPYGESDTDHQQQELFVVVAPRLAADQILRAGVRRNHYRAGRCFGAGRNPAAVVIDTGALSAARRRHRMGHAGD